MCVSFIVCKCIVCRFLDHQRTLVQRFPSVELEQVQCALMLHQNDLKDASDMLHSQDASSGVAVTTIVTTAPIMQRSFTLSHDSDPIQAFSLMISRSRENLGHPGQWQADAQRWLAEYVLLLLLLFSIRFSFVYYV
jgi:hypothetical protein